MIFLAVEMTTFETRFTSHLTTPILNSQARSSPSSQLKKRVCCRSLPRIYWKMKRGAISGPLYELSVFLSWGTAQAHIRGQKWISIPLGNELHIIWFTVSPIYEVPPGDGRTKPICFLVISRLFPGEWIWRAWAARACLSSHVSIETLFG